MNLLRVDPRQYDRPILHELYEQVRQNGNRRSRFVGSSPRGCGDALRRWCGPDRLTRQPGTHRDKSSVRTGFRQKKARKNRSLCGPYSQRRHSSTPQKICGNSSVLGSVRIKVSEEQAASGLPSSSVSAVVSGFAVGRDVQAFTLGFFVNPQADGQVDHLVGDERHHARPHHGDQHSLRLSPDL